MGFYYSETFWQIILTVLGTIGTIAAFWDKTGKPIYEKVLKPISLYLTTFAMMPKIIRHELTTNGGGSIKDLVRKSVEQNDQLIARVALISTRERAYRAINPNAMFEATPDGKCIWVNRQYLRMTGRSPEEVMGWGWLGVIADKDRDRIHKYWLECVSQNRDLDTTYTMVHSSGKEFVVSCHSHVMIDSDSSKITGHLGLITEV